MRGKEHMAIALELAARARGRTYPNPMVGAVIVKKGRIIGKGYHHRAGEDHAEVMAIKDVSGECSGSTMFVTLEPCDHYGKTPPCTQAIIDSGIRSVNIAMKDPNPLNRGKGIKKLRKAGISVDVGFLSAKAESLNRKYSKYITTGLPYITLKLAQSVDGKIAARDGTSKWISSDTSRAFSRKMRSSFDAVIIGSKTLLKDNPMLLDGKHRGNGTARVIVDSTLKTNLNSNIIKTADRAPVIIGTTELASAAKIKKMRMIDGVDVFITKSRRSKVSLKPFFTKLAKKGIINVLVEGGGELAGSLIDEFLVDEVMFFIAPKIIGGSHSSVKGLGAANISKAMDLYDVKFRKSGGDMVITGLVNSHRG